MNSSLLTLFNSSYDLHAGLSVEGGRYHYILIGKKEGKTPRVLSMQTGSTAAMRIAALSPVHAGLENCIALLVRESISGIEPEAWIDQNEERIIPKGLAAGEIINEWCMQEDEIVSGTILKKQFDEDLHNLYADRFILQSLSLPLWNLAGLYATAIAGPFIIWKIHADRSILGFVNRGCLRNACDFWVGSNDLDGFSQEACGQLTELVKSLFGPREIPRIVTVYADAMPSHKEKITIEGLEFIETPAITGIPGEYHEAYAHALHEETSLDFAPMGQSMQARNFAGSRKKALSIIRATLLSFVILAGLFLSMKAAIWVTGRYVNRTMEPLRHVLTQYTAETSRAESLAKILKKKFGFYSQKSLLTLPITEMQSAFPEGVYAVEITFSETDLSNWKVTVLALSASSGLVADLIKNLSGISGISGIRMIYSEQTVERGKSGDRDLKFKLEGNWKK